MKPPDSPLIHKIPTKTVLLHCKGSRLSNSVQYLVHNTCTVYVDKHPRNVVVSFHISQQSYPLFCVFCNLASILM